MRYLYYPGCSLKGTGKAYDESLTAVFDKLGMDVKELPGWNCCGATAYMSVDETKAFALAARNLALAEQENGSEPINLIAPCAACYLVLNKVQKYMGEYGHLRDVIANSLKAVGLNYHGTVKVRHPLDVFVNDIGLDKIKAAVSHPLKGLKVASYYGCQVVRPYADFDNQYNPQTMDQLMNALGAEAVDWPLKTRCCGGTLTGTVEEAGLRMSYILLKEASKRGANIMATACPLCQFNLECYQGKMRGTFGDSIDLPVAFFTQIMGRAFGLEAKRIGLQRLFVPVKAAPAMA
jgi:heterodisulfide reductase subunit B